jgi:hypothetical protein
VLSELGDMSHDEIAAVLDCRREKVKALVFQARTSLIASRAARDMPCAEIREQLANLRGGSLRRVEIKRHVRECAGCREFGEQVRAQRRDLAIVLPVAPTVGLKAALFGGTGAGAGVAGSAMSGGGVATKLLVAAAIAGGGTVAVEQTVSKPHPAPAPPREAAPPQAAGAVSAHEAHSAKPGTTASRHHATLAAPVRAGTTPVARRKAAKPHVRHGASKTAPGHVQKVEATPWTPPGQADKPAPHGTKPYTPPGQANKPATPPGQANKPAAQSNKPATPPGQLKKTTTPGQLKKTAAAPVTAVAPEPVKPVKTPTADKAEPADDAQG